MLDYRTQSSSLLTEAGYEDRALPTLGLARTSRWVRRFAKILLVFLVFAIVAMLFAPWQQTVSGTGNVIAYAPLDRQQVIEAPIKGRVVSWGDDIYENAPVTKGQVILRIEDLDPDLLSRLTQQRDAAQRQVNAAKDQLAAVKRQLDATRLILPSYQAQLTSFTSVREQTLAAADQLILAAEQKVRAEQESLTAAEAAEEQLKNDYDRQKYLFGEGIASEAKFQAAEQKYLKAQADVKKATAYLEAARNELDAKKKERESKSEELQTKIDSTKATISDTESKIAKAESDRGKVESDLSKAEKDLLDADVKLSRQENQVVRAPRDGFVLDLQANEGQIIKEGDELCILVPETSERAVQIWVDGNDVSLVQPGRHARLQFEGWPAVQFAGWPSVAIGTFGGEVVSVDSTDDGKGRFRVIVRPDPTDDHEWPEDRFLRQGVRANAWILLEQVPLGYELWRQLNGFPQLGAMEEPKDPAKEAEKAEKTLKLKKK